VARWLEGKVEDGLISEERRNETLYRYACSLRARSASEREIFAALTVRNEEQCSPPLDITEVKQIADSVAKYEPGRSNGASVAAKDLPIIEITTRVEAVIDAAEDAIMKASPPVVYQRAKNLCIITRECTWPHDMRHIWELVVPHLPFRFIDF
jgi:hypothetical protein